MNTDPKINDITRIEQMSSEPNPPVNSQQDENATRNGIKIREESHGIKQAKKIPMNPTRLEYSWWSTHPTEMAVITFVFFTIAMITVGTMVVCLTQPLPKGKECRFVLTSSARNLLRNDSRPHSVAIGDLNNDNLLDIIVANSGMNNIGVFLQHANGTFSDQMIYSTGSGSIPYAVAVTDSNHDQQLDVVVANFGSHTIGIFLGIGNGTFEPQISFSTGPSRPQSIAVGHFNDDAKFDIAVVNYATNDIGVFLQDTNGSFADQMTFSTAYDSDPYSLAIGDLNNDNEVDIVVANYGTDNVGVFLGYGNGTFAVHITFSTGINSHPSSVAIGHLNNDTYLDVVVACSGTNNVGVLLGYGDGTFTRPTMYPTGANSLPLSIAIADLDNDNRLDIVVANYDKGSVTVLLGDGNGNFSEQNETFYNSSNLNPYSIALGDFNNDNRFDVAVVDYDLNYVDIILNHKNYSFHSQTTYSTASDSHPTSIVIADLNNDNHQDIIVANYWSNNIFIFLGYGNGIFSSGSFVPTGPDSGPCMVAIGDFNEDNRVDLITTFYLASSTVVIFGNGDGTFSSGIALPTGDNSYPIAVAVGDFNNDNQLDVVVANYGTDNIGIFFGYGNGSFSNQVIYSTGSGSGPHSVATGDINNDNELDVVVANYWTNNVGIFLGYGNGTFSSQTIFSIGNGSRPSSVVVDDFNNDSQQDIAVVNNGAGTIGLFFGYGNGVFSSQSIFPARSGSGVWSITTGDFNKDSGLDVAVVNRLTNDIDVFVGYGNGSFSDEMTYSTGNGSSPWSIATGDLNDDGHSDIAVANSGTNNIRIFIGFGNGSFTTQKTMATTISSEPISVATGDFNNDGQLDVTVANHQNSNIRIFLGTRDGTFSSQFIYDTDLDSQPFAVVVGDLNNDSRLDIVVSFGPTNNIGVFLGYGNGTFSSQTKFSTGRDSYPFAVALGDFNNDNRLDIVVTNVQSGNIVIFLGHGDGTFFTKAIYSTGYDSQPSSAAVGDFNNDNRLDIVVTDYMTGNIGVFLGYGDGTFSNQTNYSTTKVSGPIDVVVGDLNNDGRLDIVISLAGESSISAFLANSNGTFSHQLTYSIGSASQLYSCILGDFNNDGHLDVVVADIHNDEIVVLFGVGDGSFSNRRSYPTGIDSVPTSIAFGDFNEDTILDVVVVNANTSAIGIFLGFTYINGVRKDSLSTGSSPHPRAVALGDFNRDTQLDFAITNYGLDNVEVLFQQNNKTFPMQVTLPTGFLSLPTSIVVGDFNDDGELDMSVANSGTKNIGVLYGYGNGSFMSETTFSSESNFIPQSLAAGDFNNDKRLDIVVADSSSNSIMTLLRYDPGALGNRTMYSTGTDSHPIAVAVSDLNNDGWLDFVVADGGSGNVGVFLGLGDGTFSNQTTYSTGSDFYPRCITVADLSKDGHLDIIVCNVLNDTIGIFHGFGNGTFFSEIIPLFGQSFAPVDIATGDFNNDSWLDIVVTNYGSNDMEIFLASDNGTFSTVITYSTGNHSEPCSIVVGDFNNDHYLDVVVANANGGDLGVFLGYGNGTFSVMVAYSTGSPSGPASVVVGDFNNDNQLDLAVANSVTDEIGVLFGYGDGTFSIQTTHPITSGSIPYSLATGDFNNDNQLDIAVVNQGSNSFSVLLGFNNGTFFRPLNYAIADGSHPSSITVGDFNNDNRLDIIVTSTNIGNVGIFFGYVSESFLFALPYLTEALSQPTDLAVGDFNNDTRLDVVVTNKGTDNVMVLLGSGYGTFINHKTYSTGNDSHPCGVAVGDFNNDSRLDIVVANSGTNNIGVFLSNGSGTFSNQVTYSTDVDSQPHSVAVLDFNDDTRLDIAVANYGSDTIIVFFGDGKGSFTITNQSIYYTGFDSHPYGIAVGDINNDNQSDIVVTNDGYGNIDVISKEC